MADERPRFRIGQKFRSHITGTVSEIVADYHFHPNVMKTAQITDDRYYVVEVDGHRSVQFHGLIAAYADPIEDAPAPEDPAAE